MRRQGKKLAQVARTQARGLLHIPGSRDAPEAEFEEALAAFGFRQGGGEGEEGGQPEVASKCYLWPCNVAAFNTWQRVQTQWRENAMGERTGLDYASVASYLREVPAIKARDRAELFGFLQAMELAALAAWAEKRD